MQKTKCVARIFAVLLSALAFCFAGASFILSFRNSTAVSYDTVIGINSSQRFQRFDGWGTTLGWWANEVGGWTKPGENGLERREEIMRAIFGEDGLDLNIARYNVGGGDDPTHTHMSDDRNMPGFRAEETGGYVWETLNGDASWETLPDANQLWALDWLQRERDDAIVEYFSNSPPYWMTVTGCSSGNGSESNLKPGYEDRFVEYFLDVFEYLTSQGFSFDYMQPFNEPSSGYWDTYGSQEGCDFTTAQKVDILSAMLVEAAERGIEAPLNFADETNTSTAVQTYEDVLASERFTDAGMTGRDILEQVGKLTYHIYSYERENAQKLYRYAQNNGQKIWMSEVCYPGGETYDPEAMDAGFSYSEGIIDDIKYGGVDAYVFWQAVEDMLAQIASDTNYGLLLGVYQTQDEALEQGVDLASQGLAYQDFVVSKSYYMVGQFTKYIKQGYTIVSSDDDKTLAAISPDGTQLVIVKENNSDEVLSARYTFDDFLAESVTRIETNASENWKTSSVSTDGSSVCDTVGENCIVTYVVEGEYNGAPEQYTDDSAARYVEGNGLSSLSEAVSSAGDSFGIFTNIETVGEGNGLYGSSIYTDSSDKYVAVRFYGTGCAVVAPKKDDAGTLKIWLDSHPDAAEPQLVGLYSETEQWGEPVFRINSLERGWHTVWLAVENGYFNFDGIYSIDGAETVSAPTPHLQSAVGKDGKIYLQWSDAGRAEGTEYYVEYRSDAEWIRTEAESESFCFLPSRDALSYEVRIVAEGTDGVRRSNTLVAEMNTGTSGVLYFVDCGTNDLAGQFPGRIFGVCHSLYDQPFGADPASGLRWGYTVAEDSISYFGAEDVFGSIASGDSALDNKVIYRFQIPEAGEYRFTFAFYDPWGAAERAMNVGVRGDSHTGEKMFAENYIAGSLCSVLSGIYTTTQADTFVEVEVSSSAADSEYAPLLSAILITETYTVLPMYAQYASNYASQMPSAGGTVDIGEDFSAAVAQTLSVTMSDGSVREFTVGRDMEANISVQSVAADQTLLVEYLIPSIGMEIPVNYTVSQEGILLYYNIDCGSNGAYYKDTLFTPGLLQAGGAFDQQYTATNGWGYIEQSSAGWENDRDEVSLRYSDEDTLTYILTGFAANESVNMILCAQAKDWGDRSFTVSVNGVPVGIFELYNNGMTKETYSANADENGYLKIVCTRLTGDTPQMSYIRVYSAGEESEEKVPAAIGSDKQSYLRSENVQLIGLDTEARVYVLDEAGKLIDSFIPSASAMVWRLSDLPGNVRIVRFMQAYSGGRRASSELIIDIPEVDCLYETGYSETSKVLRFRPYALYGIQTLTVTMPDGVTRDLIDSFFCIADENGKYVVTMVSNGVTYMETISIDTIDAISLDAQYSTEEWTDRDITVTVIPSAASGIDAVYIDGVLQQLQAQYVITASENAQYTVTVVSSAGFTKEFFVDVSNIDKNKPSLSIRPDFSNPAGVYLEYEADSVSGGNLYVSVDGGDRVMSSDIGHYIAVGAGIYEFVFINGVGAESDSIALRITYGIDNAYICEVTQTEEGLSVQEGICAALYRAGERKAEDSLVISGPGKYYLLLDGAGEIEVIVFTQPIVADVVSSGQGLPAWAVAVIAIVAAVILGGTVVAVLYVRRRKRA